MALDAGSVVATLSGKFSPAGFAAFDKAMYASKGRAEAFEKSLVASNKRAGKSVVALGDAGAKTDKLLAKAAKVGVYGFTAGVAALGAVAVTSSKKALSFQKQLHTLQAVSGASEKQLKRLEKQAHSLGIEFGVGATKAAGAMVELAKGGLSVDKIIRGGLKGALALAAAGELDVATAGETVANALNLFKLRGEDATHVADALATAANKTTADVGHFAMALTQGGAAAKAAGLDFDQTVGFLEALAAAGVKGSDAGTSMKAALTQLASPTAKSRDLQKKLNLEFFDTEGNLKPLPRLADMLGDKLGDLTRKQRLQAATTLAGTDGMRALLALYDAGPRKVQAFIDGLEKQGTATEVAIKKQSPAERALRQLGAAWETARIQIGNELLPVIADLAGDAAAKLKELAESGDLKDFGQDLAGGIRAVADALNALKAAADGTIGAVEDVIDWVEGALDTLEEFDKATFGALGNWMRGKAESEFKERLGNLNMQFEIDPSSKAAFEGLLQRLLDLGRTDIAINILTNAKSAQAALMALQAAADGVPDSIVLQILQNAKTASAQVAAFSAVAQGVPARKVLKILQNAPSAQFAIARLNGEIAAIPSSKTSTITIITRRIEEISRRVGGRPVTSTGKVLPKARGGRAYGAETAVIGEGGGPEYRIDGSTGQGYVAHGAQLADLNAGDYVIPLEDRFRGRALDLFWMLARDLGVDMYAGGKKGKGPGKNKGKPPKKKRHVPGPSQFLRLDPAEFNDDRDQAKQRLDRLEDAAKEKDAKGKLTKAAVRARARLAEARRKFEKADALAKKANAHARAVEKQDELAEIFRQDMQIADNRDDQKAFDLAKGRRGTALKAARRLLKQALRYAKPGSKWERALRQRIGQATLDIDDTKGSALDVEGLGEPELLTPAEQARADELDAALALAELTETIEGPGEDRDILTQLVAFREGVLGRHRATGAHAFIAQAARDVKDARDQLRDLTPGENVQAQLDQANERARIAERGREIAEGSLRVLDGVTDANRIGAAPAGPSITIQTLHPGDSRTLDAIGRAATAGQGMQGARRSPREVLGV